MSADFVDYFRDDLEQLQTYAREYRQGDHKNRGELDRHISIILRRFHPSVEFALANPSEDPQIEDRRLTHLRWKRRFLIYTNWMKYVIFVLAVGLLGTIGICGSGSAGARIAYWCFFGAAAVIFGVTGWLLYAFKQSTKEFLIENILAG